MRWVVDQLEPWPWPVDRTSTREVAVAYIALAKFDDPPLGKSNAADAVAVAWRLLVCETRRRFFKLTPRNTVVRGDFWLAIEKSSMPKPVDRELPRWQQRPDFAGDRSRFVAISDTRCTSLMFRGGRKTEWGRENNGRAGSQRNLLFVIYFIALYKRKEYKH